MKKIFITVISLIFILILGACSKNRNAPEEVQVLNIWSRPALEGNNSAVYFIIMNDQKEDDKLILAETSIAESTEIHLSSNVDGVMKMIQQDFVEIKAGKITGFYQTPDCSNAQKKLRILEKYRLEDYAEIYAYGNSEEDQEMLSLAHQRYLEGQDKQLPKINLPSDSMTY